MKKSIHRKRNTILIVSLLSIVLVLSGCKDSVEVTKEQKQEVTATVTDINKTIVPPTYYFSPATKTMMPLFHPTKYNVTVTYEDLSQEFNNQDLYDSVCIGDTIQVILYESWNSEGEAKKELLLP